MPDEPDWDARDLAALLGEQNPHDPRNYWLCPAGRHWGRFGAAGLLPWCRYHGQVHVLLSLRSSLVEDGGCWGTLGGAIDGGEPGWLAALREAHEEARIHVNAGSIDVNAGSIGSEVVWACPEQCGWGYTTYLVHMEAGRELPDVHIRRSASWETAMLRWFPVDEVPDLDLHPGLRSAWPDIVALL